MVQTNSVIPLQRARARRRAVVIGGGVAGCSIAYHLARLGWTDVVAGRAARPDRGHHLALGRLRRPAALHHQPDPDDHVLVGALRRAARARPASTRAGAASAGCAWPPRPSGSRSCAARSSAATTYGLELDAAVAGRDAASCCRCSTSTTCSPPAGCPATATCDPEPLARALAAGRRARSGVRVRHRHPGHRHRGRRRPGARRCVTDAGRDRRPRSWSTRPARRPGTSAGWPASTSRSCRSSTSTSSPSRSTPAVDARTSRPCATPTTSSTSAARATALLVGGYIRTPEVCWPTTARAAGASRARCSSPTWPSFAESWAAARRRVPALRDAAIARVVHGPEAFTPDGEFLLGETAVRRFWVAAGFCVHGLAAAGGVGKVMAEWIVDGTPEYDVAAHGHPPLRRARREPVAGPRRKALDAYSRYYDIVYPGQEWTAGPAAAPLGRPGRGCPTLDAALGEKAGWERVELVRRPTRPAATRRCARAAGPGGSGRRRSRPRCRATADAAGLFDQSSFAKLDVRGAGRGRVPAAAVRQRRRPAGRHASSTPSCSTSAAGIEADLTVTRLGEDALPHRHQHRVRRARRWPGCAGTPRAGRASTTSPARYGCLCLWGPARPRHPAAAHRRRPSDVDFPFLRARRLTRRRRAGARPAGHVRRRARLGALRARPSTR